MCACVEPGITTAHYPYFQAALSEVIAVHIGDLILTSSRRGQIPGNLHYLIIIKIKSGNCIIRFRLSRLFFNTYRFHLRIKFNHPISFRITYMIRKNISSLHIIECLQLTVQP